MSHVTDPPSGNTSDRMTRHTGRSGIEKTGFGDGAVLFSSASGVVIHADPLASLIFDIWKDGGDATTLARFLGAGDGPEDHELRQDTRVAFEGTVSHWSQAGLFRDAPAPFSDPATDDGRPAPHRLHLSATGRTVQVETDIPQLAVELGDIFFNMKSDAAGPGQDSRVLRCITQADGGLGLFENGKALWGRTDIDEARFLLLRDVAAELCGGPSVGAILHGAAVSGQNGALLLIGESGHGKSTLAQGLVAAGCGFVADDHIPLDQNGTHVAAFPTAASVKTGARALDEVQTLIKTYQVSGSTRDGVQYLRIPASAPMGNRIKVCAIVVPKYAHTATYRMDRIDPEDAFTTCVLAGARANRVAPSMAPLATLCQSVPCYELSYRSSDQSVAACQKLLRR